MPPPDSRPVFPFLPGVTPNFTQHYDYRWTVDRLPFSGADRAHIQGWVRPRADAPVDDATLAALVDAWPSPVLSLADRPVPASTVTWHRNIVAPVGEAPADAWWAWDAVVSASDHGYADMEGRLYDARGRLVAVSRQLMVEFSGR
jgi:acyl-CoA thioesterase